MEALRACFFGFPQISLNGNPLQPERRKVLALLIYLLSTGKACSRESLATLFWPDQDQQQASAYLRNALSEIRRLIGEEWLDLEGKTVRLRLERSAWVDTRQFEDLAESVTSDAVSLQQAVDIYQGDFLAGFSLSDTLDFDNWQTARAEELRLSLDQTLEKLTAAYINTNELDSAVAAARRRVDLDPLNEAAQRVLIELLARSGQRSAALHQFETCQRVLKDELDVSPEAETLKLFRRVSSGEFTPIRSPETILPEKSVQVGNLPAATVPLVGRKDELEQLRQMLADPTCRLLTITGPGGAGKTSLALEAARQQSNLFADGAWFIPLAQIDAPTRIVPAIAEILHLPLPGMGGRSSDLNLLGPVLEYLNNKKLLLVIDNLEHLLAGELPIQDLLTGAPGIKILATSRERLNLPAEWVLPIAGMPIPRLSAVITSEENDAVQLFLAAARRTVAGYQPQPEDWAAIERICQLVDGLPLGLELAASMVHVLPCLEIASEMEQTLDFLASHQRGVAERQRSLRAAFNYSWKLLADSERAALRRLTVFQGGFDRQAAAQVAGVTLPVLGSLVDKSLLQRLVNSRFDLHPAIKQYANEHLNENQTEFNQVHNWHSGYFLDKLTDWFEELKGSQQIVALEKVAREQANLFTAWNWAIQQQNITAIKQSAPALTLTLIMRGQRGEGHAFFEPLGKLARQSNNKSLLAFHLAAFRYFVPFDSSFSGQPEMESLDLIPQIDDSAEKAYASILLAMSPGKVPSGKKLELSQQSAEYFHAHGDDWGAGIATLVLADNQFLGFHQQDLANESYHRSLDLFTHQGNNWGRMLALNGLAYIANDTGQYTQAASLLAECIPFYEQVGDVFRITESRLFLGRVLVRLGKPDEAIRCVESILPLLERMGWKGYQALCRQFLQGLKHK